MTAVLQMSDFEFDAFSMRICLGSSLFTKVVLSHKGTKELTIVQHVVHVVKNRKVLNSKEYHYQMLFIIKQIIMGINKYKACYTYHA